MATPENVLEPKTKIMEQGNYSRRNNILIQNIPEGVEDPDCIEFDKRFCFLKEQLDTSTDIEDAHRTPGRLPSVGIKPRMIVTRYDR